MRGLMQEQPLVVTSILDYAAKVHGEQVRMDSKSWGASWR